jgi:hypothetical protein
LLPLIAVYLFIRIFIHACEGFDDEKGFGKRSCMYIKRFSMVWFLSIATMGLFSCASGGAELETTSLHGAIRETAANIEARLEGGTKIALLNFSSPVSGEVSGESAQVIGRKLGAQAVVSGSLTQSRGAYRFRVKTLTVET